MFKTRCSSFCSIVPCSFEFILMDKSLVQECYMMFTAITYQNLMFCYFCCIWCVHLMAMSSTCVLDYAMPYLQGCMPCIFVIYVVTSRSMQSSLPDVADFCDLRWSPGVFRSIGHIGLSQTSNSFEVISAKSECVTFCCYVAMLLP